MTPLSDSPASSGVSARLHEGSSLETPSFNELRTRVAGALQRHAGEIAARWEHQARSVALRDEGAATGTVSGNDDAATGLIRSLAGSLGSDTTATGDGIALGLAFGVEAFETGVSLHHTLKGLDLLSAMTLYAVESAVAGEGIGGGDMADGVRLCRRLQQATSLLSLAATKGYTQAMSDGLRDRYRHLRHDLRNPLGTIKSVLALMDDDTIPAEARAHPRFRAMAERNARSLDAMIVNRLSDAAALSPALSSYQRVSLRMIACNARRDLRAEADARETSIVVAEAGVRVCVDAVSLELTLHALLLAALQESNGGDELSIDFGEATPDRATIFVTRASVSVSAGPPVADPTASDRLVSLATRMGAKLTIGDVMTLSVPLRRDETDDTPETPRVGETEVAAPSVTRGDAPVA